MPIMEGFARRFLSLRGGKNPTEVRFTHQESLAIAQVEPEGMEATRAGRRFRSAFNGTPPTGIAPVQAIPTVAAQWALFNADPINSYIMTTVGTMIFSGTQGVGGTVLGTIFQLPAQSGFSTGLAVANMSNSSLGSKASIKSGISIATPAAPIWAPVAALPDAADTVGGQAAPSSDMKGRMIIPPGYGLGISVFSAAGTTPLFLPYFDWIELPIDLE